MGQLKHVIIGELALDSATKRFSGERVRRNSTASPPAAQIIYAGTVLHWGSIDKSIPCPSGMPQISNAHVRISDHYREWRNALCLEPARRRIMTIYVLPEGASVAAHSPVYVGEVVDVVFNPAEITIELRDRTFAWLDEEIPAMAVPELYPDVTPNDEGGFIPIPFGECLSPVTSPPTAEGLISLPHIGMVGDPNSPPVQVDRWVAAATPVLAVTVYRRQTASVDQPVDTPEWVGVSPSEYTLNLLPIAANANPYGSFTMTHTCVDFHDQQPEGTELRAEIRGIYTRGAWGSLTAVDGSMVSPPVTLRNPIDAFINMTFFLMQKAGVSINVFDTTEIGALRTIFQSLPIFCDGAITEVMTGREWLGRFLSSFELDLIQNRRGLISLRFTRDLSSTSPPTIFQLFREGEHMLRESFMERLPENIVTQIQGRFKYDNARNRWADWTIIDTDEQTVLNMPDPGSPTGTLEKIEKAVVDLYFVRDQSTAINTINNRVAFQSIGSFRQEFKIPMPVALDAGIELADLIKITHSMGLQTGGYVARQVKVLGISHDLDNMITTLKTILWPPASFVFSGRPTLSQEGSGWDSSVSNPANSFDPDGNVGSSNTFATFTIRSTRPLASNYARQHLFGFPAASFAFTTATIKIDAQYVVPEDSGGQPASAMEIHNALQEELPGTAASNSTVKGAVLLNTGAMEPGLARATYTVAFTAAQFATFFPLGVSQLYAKIIQYGSLSLDFPQPIELRVYDVWIEYT